MNTWDETKRAVNLAKHGVDFVVAEGFDWETALTAVDDRGTMAKATSSPSATSAPACT
jgi:hypothetical protein